MNKHIRYSARKYLPKYAPSPAAINLWLAGLPFLLLALCDVGVKIHEGIASGAVGFMLHLGYGLECIVAGLAILTGAALLLDYMERKAVFFDTP